MQDKLTCPYCPPGSPQAATCPGYGRCHCGECNERTQPARQRRHMLGASVRPGQFAKFAPNHHEHGKPRGQRTPPMSRRELAKMVEDRQR